MFSGASDKKVFDGNTILLKISEEKGKNEYVYIGGDMLCFFVTSDTIYEYISNMSNNLCPYSISISISISIIREKKFTICWLRISNLLKRIRLIMILYWMEYTFQIQTSLLKNWVFVKFNHIMIRSNKNMFS